MMNMNILAVLTPPFIYQLHTIKKKKVKKSTIETKFDKLGNKVSMLENSKKVDEYKVTKENNISLSRYPTALSPSGIVETSYKNDTSLMIEAEETPQEKHWKIEI